MRSAAATGRRAWCVPFKGSRSVVTGARRASPRSGPPLMESTALECCYAPSYRRLRVASLPSLPRCFQRTEMVFRAVPSSVFPREAGSSSCELGLSSSVGRVHVGPFTSDPGRLPWGLSSASRRRPSESTRRRASQARLGSALSVSHALDGLLLAWICRSVSLCCHVPDSRDGRLAPPQRYHLVGGPALSPLASRLCRRLPDDAKPRRVDLRTLFRVGMPVRAARG